MRRREDECARPSRAQITSFVSEQSEKRAPYCTSCRIIIITFVLLCALCGYTLFGEDVMKEVIRQTTEVRVNFHDRYWKNVLAKEDLGPPEPIILSATGRIPSRRPMGRHVYVEGKRVMICTEKFLLARNVRCGTATPSLVATSRHDTARCHHVPCSTPERRWTKH